MASLTDGAGNYIYADTGGNTPSIKAVSPAAALSTVSTIPGADPRTGVQHVTPPAATASPTVTPAPTPASSTPTTSTQPAAPSPDTKVIYDGITFNNSQDATNYAQESAKVAAQNFGNTVMSIQNGSIPLSPGEQAQIAALKSQYDTIIAAQQLQNTNATGVANIRGYQTGAAEYDNAFQAKVIGSIASAGFAKVAALQVEEAGAIAALTQKLKDGDIAGVKMAYDAYTEANNKRTDQLRKTIEDTQKAIKDAQEAKIAAEKTYYEEVTKPIQSILTSAAKYGADAATLSQIKAATSVEDAIEIAGSSLQDPKAKYEIQGMLIDMEYKRAQIQKLRRETEEVGQPTASERKAIEAEKKAQETMLPVLRDKVALIDSLKDATGLSAAVGPNPLAWFSSSNWYTGVKDDFIAGVNQLINKETMDTLINLKAQGGTLGALSDQERILLQTAASKIGTWQVFDDTGKVVGYKTSEETFKKELDNLRYLTQRAIEKAQGQLFNEAEANTLDAVYGQPTQSGTEFNPNNYF